MTRRCVWILTRRCVWMYLRFKPKIDEGLWKFPKPINGVGEQLLQKIIYKGGIWRSINILLLLELCCVTLNIMVLNLGIFAVGFWIMNILYDVRWQEGHPFCKLSLVNMYSELKGYAVPLVEGTNIECPELSVLISNIVLLCNWLY